MVLGTARIGSFLDDGQHVRANRPGREIKPERAKFMEKLDGQD